MADDQRFNSSLRVSPSHFRGVVALDASQVDSLLQHQDQQDQQDQHPHLSQDAELSHSASTAAATASANHAQNGQDLLLPITAPAAAPTAIAASPNVRSRRPKAHRDHHSKRRGRRRTSSKDYHAESFASSSSASTCFGCCRPSANGCCQRYQALVRSTLSCMNILARILFWCSALASVAAVVWYSIELRKHGKDPHLIAWFSAGAFVIMGFPISMYGIVLHLANYNQPNVQVYVVRILWMVPIYSVESWLCLRYKDYAIYIETLRDVYESYVLYSFLQFLIQVLGGEEALILMLKDKSPTRGVHMWGMQWCIKPWLMGQPLRKTYDIGPDVGPTAPGGEAFNMASHGEGHHHHLAIATTVNQSSSPRPLKRVHWTSPFFVKCKFGVLQYVLLKIVCAALVVVLERYGLYKEGDFTPRRGYLYICIVTNLSQCWALYCLFFLYLATKNELSSIRPVGKFLSVKSLVFFTWWQSVMISILYQMDLIPNYSSAFGISFGDVGAATLMPGMASADPTSVPGALLGTEESVANLAQQEWSAEDVAKGIQDWLICIEMFIAALVHIVVFPHTEYDPQAVEARRIALNQAPHKDWNKRLGRKWKEWDNKSGWSVSTNNSSEMEMTSLLQPSGSMDEEDDLRIHPLDRQQGERFVDDNLEVRRLLDPIVSEVDDDNSSVYSLDNSVLHDDESESDDEDLPDLPDVEQARGRANSMSSIPSISSANQNKPGFVRALIDSAIPQDLRDNTVGIIKGEYVVERKTLLHHAATSDSYELFSRVNKPKWIKAKKPNPSS
eukprot:Nitzschia sp. Nitz4//scaffold9_size221794//163764//166205//NITZ4_001370-RA/size221794-snap-gene-0.109-mRNA-1//1//CDS//3329561073//2162//frame0